MLIEYSMIVLYYVVVDYLMDNVMMEQVLFDFDVEIIMGINIHQVYLFHNKVLLYVKDNQFE